MNAYVVAGILIPLVVVIGGAIQSVNAKERGNNLHRKFVGMGTLVGRTRDEVTAIVGRPKFGSGAGNDAVLLEWHEQNYRIGLLFRKDICEGVSFEHFELE